MTGKPAFFTKLIATPESALSVIEIVLHGLVLDTIHYDLKATEQARWAPSLF